MPSGRAEQMREDKTHNIHPSSKLTHVQCSSNSVSVHKLRALSPFKLPRVNGMIVLAFTTPALGQSFYVGTWAGPETSCNAENIDRVPMRIFEDSISFYETSCKLTTPVEIRGMKAKLFDFECVGEGFAWEYRGLLLLNDDDTLEFSADGQTNTFRRCE